MHLRLKDTPALPPGLCAMQQHPYYASALQELGATVRAIAFQNGQHRVAQAQIVSRRLGPLKLWWLPRGPVWATGPETHDKQDILDQLAHSAPPGTALISLPDTPDDQPLFTQTGHRKLLPSQKVAEIALTGSQDDRLSAQSVKWRNRLRHALKSPLHISHCPFNSARDRWLLKHDLIQQRQKRFRALPPAFTLAWAKHHPEATRLFLAHLRGRVVAAMLFLRHPPTASYHIGWINTEGRRHSAHNLLLWQAQNWLADQGCLRLDLGGVDPSAAPGLARFKRGSGATIRDLGPTMLRLPRLTRRRIAA